MCFSNIPENESGSKKSVALTIVECSVVGDGRHVLLLGLLPSLHPMDEKASPKPDTGLLLSLPADNLSSTVHPAFQQVRFTTRPWHQLHCLRNSRNSASERLLQRVSVRDICCG